ncbi:MAG: 30S ribosome-binding factor RbfA [Rhodospirillales bacterium]|nr:30S ribosome-binding factor RbfA [Rhodospirillales bacterium]MBO6787543.1 30S ribosome-binding factor RbfA [Rhodospirillales bacterium]
MSRQPARTPSQRQLRVGEEVRHVLALALERGEIRDPAVKGVAITVTEVRISPDLKNATAFVVPLGGGDAAPIVKALNKASGFLRSWVSQHVQLRYTPRIAFEADLSFDEAQRIENVLNDPRVRRDLTRADEPENDA